MDKFLKQTQPVLHETDESSTNSESETNEMTTTSEKCSAKKQKYDED